MISNFVVHWYFRCRVVHWDINVVLWCINIVQRDLVSMHLGIDMMNISLMHRSVLQWFWVSMN